MIYDMLAGIGATILLYYGIRIFLEIVEVILYASGLTLLYLLNVKWHVAKRKPFAILRFLLKVFKAGILESVSYFRPSKVMLGKWIWRPLFRFEKRE